MGQIPTGPGGPFSPGIPGRPGSPDFPGDPGVPGCAKFSFFFMYNNSTSSKPGAPGNPGTPTAPAGPGGPLRPGRPTSRIALQIGVLGKEKFINGEYNNICTISSWLSPRSVNAIRAWFTTIAGWTAQCKEIARRCGMYDGWHLSKKVCCCELTHPIRVRLLCLFGPSHLASHSVQAHLALKIGESNFCWEN